MKKQNDSREIEEIAGVLLCLSEQMALQPPQIRDNRLINVLNALGERLNCIKKQ